MNKDIKVGENGIPKAKKLKDLNLNTNTSLFGLFKGDSFFQKIKDIWLLIKYSYQRIKYGISSYDSFNLYYSIQVLMENGVKELNNGRWGHPYNMTEEEWNSILKKIANNLEFVNSEECEGPWNIYWELSHKYDKDDERVREAFEYWMDYSKKYEEKQHETMLNTLDLMKKYWEHLWD